MGKSILFLLAIALTIVGTAVTAGHPAWAAWGTFAGVAILLSAAGLAAVALILRSQAESDVVKQKVANQKISNTLVTLSSAAILAVYAAGYHRTGSAAYQFDVQEARRKAAARIAIAAAVQPTPIPSVASTPAFSPPLAPPATKSKPRPSSLTARKAAPAPPPPITDPAAEAAAEVKPQIQYKDGTYLGWGYSRHGNIQASVVIQDGKIASTAIVQCLTRYPCSWIRDLPDEAVTKQSENIDFVSGATESSEAFSDAVAAALSQAE